MYEISVQVFSAIFEAVLIYYWVRAFAKETTVHREIIIAKVVLVSGVVLFSLIYFTNPMALISFTVLSCLFMFYTQRVSWKISLVATLVFCVVMALCDVLTTYFVMLFSYESIENIRFTPNYMFITNAITKFLLLGFVSFVYTRQELEFRGTLIRRTIYLLILPLASIVLLYQMLNFNNMNNPFSIIMCLVGVTGLAVGNIYTITFFEKEQKLEEQHNNEVFLKQQMEQQRIYYQNLEASENEVRKIRHDLKNTFTALSGYLEAGSINQANTFIQKEIQTINSLTSGTGHYAVDAVINAKKAVAKRQQTDFESCLALPEVLGVDEMDLCILLGNALDNALEACEPMPKGQRAIKLEIRKVSEMLFIKIANTTLKLPKENSQGFLTSKDDKKNHGFGLKTMRQLVEQYQGSLDYEMSKGWFCLIMNLNCKDPVNLKR